jgi:hypothetical protein
LTCTMSPSRSPASLKAGRGMVIWCLLEIRDRPALRLVPDFASPLVLFASSVVPPDAPAA